MRRDIVSISVGILPPLGLQRESLPVHISPAVFDCVLLAVSGNHSANLAGGAVTRQVPVVHHDTGYPISYGDHRGAQLQLQVKIIISILISYSS